MPKAHYDRLSATDMVFLELEDANVSMHIGAVSIFEGAELLAPDGALDIERLRAYIEAALPSNPRLRQRLAYVPLLNHPVWIDDGHFDLAYHVRHTSLPHPGDVVALKQLAGRIMSQRLDRSKPLWEMWFVEGMQGHRFGLVSKFHHCMIDGISGVDILASFLRFDPIPALPPAARWRPRPAPSPERLLADEVGHRASRSLEALRSASRMLFDSDRRVDSLTELLGGIGEAAAANLRIASPTPFNRSVGPNRRFDWIRFDLERAKEIKNRLGGTVNDVVLAVVAGAVGRFLEMRGVDLHGLDVRMTMPANLRSAEEHGKLGNRVGVLTISLPVAERNPRRRLDTIVETTRGLRQSGQLRGVELVAELSDGIFPPLAGQLARLAARARTYNFSVTNIPGPQVPAYLLCARMREIYPLAFLFSHQALTIAILSYDGGLFWALTADWDAIPDLSDLIAATRTELAGLYKAATARRTPRAGRPRRTRSKVGTT